MKDLSKLFISGSIKRIIKYDRKQGNYMLKNKKFENFISLGYFCEVASDLEKLGLRNTSSPFDWCITDLKMNIRLIDNKFNNFMNYENLKQSCQNRNIYMDTVYKDFFFHDFSKYKSLDSQYPKVKAKYNRRIQRFLTNIEKPTLFIRYISNEVKNSNGRSAELEWIENNREHILKVLKKYNSQNEIIYIGDYNTNSDIIKIFHVPIEDNDLVSRSPIINNKELYPLVKGFHIKGQEDNINRYLKKQKRKNDIRTKAKKKIMRKYNKLFKKVYIYSREYNIKGK